jgi:hypothetical protein
MISPARTALMVVDCQRGRDQGGPAPFPPPDELAFYNCWAHGIRTMAQMRDEAGPRSNWIPAPVLGI